MVGQLEKARPHGNPSRKRPHLIEMIECGRFILQGGGEAHRFIECLSLKNPRLSIAASSPESRSLSVCGSLKNCRN
jgi:hypothetical protein